jgi:hypothetical protein
MRQVIFSKNETPEILGSFETFSSGRDFDGGGPWLA